MRRSLDEAKSYVLSTQFRSVEKLEQNARAIRAGEAVSFGTEELELARRIANWNAAVTASFLLAAILLGVLVGAALSGLSFWSIAVLGVSAAICLGVSFALMNHVRRIVCAVSTAPAKRVA